jgi:hypothetical protein
VSLRVNGNAAGFTCFLTPHIILIPAAWLRWQLNSRKAQLLVATVGKNSISAESAFPTANVRAARDEIRRSVAKPLQEFAR